MCSPTCWLLQKGHLAPQVYRHLFIYYTVTNGIQHNPLKVFVFSLSGKQKVTGWLPAFHIGREKYKREVRSSLCIDPFTSDKNEKHRAQFSCSALKSCIIMKQIASILIYLYIFMMKRKSSYKEEPSKFNTK